MNAAVRAAAGTAWRVAMIPCAIGLRGVATLLLGVAKVPIVGADWAAAGAARCESWAAASAHRPDPSRARETEP